MILLLILADLAHKIQFIIKRKVNVSTIALKDNISIGKQESVLAFAQHL